MRNTLKFLGIIAVALIAGFAITACDTPTQVNFWTVKWVLGEGGQWPDGAKPPAQVDKDAVLGKPSPDPIKDHYIFYKWCDDAALSKSYNFSSPVTENLTLYATWNPIWYITWELDGGAWQNASPPKYVPIDGVLARPEFEPFKNGYVFSGWYSDADFTEEYDFTLPITGDSTVYANWERIYWTVSWELNGGTLDVDPPNRVGFDDILSAPSEPLKTDYIFRGWYTDSDFTVEYDFSEPVTADLALYAKWEYIYWTVTWDLKGGTTTATLRDWVEKNTVLTKPTPDPTKAGNEFLGWYSNAALTVEYSFSAAVTGDLALYAKWDPEYFNITWHWNGGETTATPPTRVEYGTVLARPPNPSKADYTFRGWYRDFELTTPYIFSAQVTTNLDLYAKWEQGGASGARYLAFTSDVHWSSGSSSYPLPIYEQWMDELMTQYDNLDYMGFCGDLGIPNESGSQFWTNVKTLMDTANTYVTNGFITGDSGLLTGGNLFGLGNHEWYTAGGGNLAANPTGYAQERLFYNHTVIDEGDYIIYPLGPIGTGSEGTGCTQQFAQPEIDRLAAYLATVPSNVPIFIMAHHPIHIYNAGTPLRITQNADSLLDVLQGYPNVFFMWGHNHSDPDPMWDKYHVAGDTIQTTNDSSSRRELNFTYFGPGAMRDTEYGGDQGKTGQYVKAKGTIAKIENGQVMLTYYDNQCNPLQGNKHNGDPVINPVTVTMGVAAPFNTVTFDKNNTDAGSTEASPRSKRVTSPATNVGTLPTPPARTGYNFTGWNTLQNGSGTPFIATTTVSSNITVYAQWQARPYTVTFNKNGGDTEANPPSKTVTYPVTTVGTLPAPPTRAENYTFTGWNTLPNGSGTSFTAATAVSADITVYAQWWRPWQPGDPYTVDLSGQTTKFATAANNDGGSVSLEFPTGFNVTHYAKFTIKLDFLDSSQARINSTSSQYLAADFFKNWTGSSTRPAIGDRLQTVSPARGVSDNDAIGGGTATNNNGFTITRDSGFNVNPEGLWVQKAGGNSLRYIEILEIRFHNDP